MNGTGNARVACYANVRHEIETGDLLLFRRPSPRGAIAVAGRGLHVHAAMAVWRRNASGHRKDLFALESKALRGVHPVSLSRMVRENSNLVDWYRADPEGRWPEFKAEHAADVLWRLCGQSYGYAALARAVLLHVPIVRWLIDPDLDDEHCTRQPPFCSHAVALATRIGGGVDPVPNLADRAVEPADLARSLFYRYTATLVAPPMKE